MKTYIFILYFQKRIELLSSAMEVLTMNDRILNMLKADLTVLDKLEIKPNFANWIPMLLSLKKSFLSEEFLTREYTECFFPNTRKEVKFCLRIIVFSLVNPEFWCILKKIKSISL